MPRESVIIAPNSSILHKEEPAFIEEISIEKQFESIKSKASPTLMQALFVLNNIVSKQLPPARFSEIYPIFSSSSPSEEEK